MSKFCKIQVYTGSRAEYGLLRNLIRRIESEKSFILKLVVTGSHLSPEYGNTIEEIKKDGIRIDKRIEMLLNTNSKIGITKSIGLSLLSVAEYLEESSPDLVILLGDRYEILPVAIGALISSIPVAHIHGGELTYGAYDDAIRHSISKMSFLHFVATEEYKNRVIQLGEDPKRVFNVGGMGVDSINNIKLLSRNDLEKELNFEFGLKNLLVTYHPTTLSPQSSKTEINTILEALKMYEDISLIFTYPNADNDSFEIIKSIKNFCFNRKNSIFVKSLGQIKYFSFINHVDGVLGNSSSGLIEVPSFKKGTINIGFRQDGRIKAESVIDCEVSKESIKSGIEKLYSSNFQEKIKNVLNPYGSGGATEKIIDIIKNFDKPEEIQKEFFDIHNIR